MMTRQVKVLKIETPHPNMYIGSILGDRRAGGYNVPIFFGGG
jgi:hypothetical protein